MTFIIDPKDDEIRTNIQRGIATADVVHQFYTPMDRPPPKGVKLTILTSGGVQVQGPWRDDSNFVAWAPLLSVTPGIHDVVVKSYRRHDLLRWGNLRFHDRGPRCHNSVVHGVMNDVLDAGPPVEGTLDLHIAYTFKEMGTAFLNGLDVWNGCDLHIRTCSHINRMNVGITFKNNGRPQALILVGSAPSRAGALQLANRIRDPDARYYVQFTGRQPSGTESSGAHGVVWTGPGPAPADFFDI